jgi:DNA-binding LacI/PurR family transcriptional regulator
LISFKNEAEEKMTNLNVSYNSKALRLSKQLLTEIQEGRYSPGTPFPSTDEIAVQYEVSRPTARRAISFLTAQNELKKLPQRGLVITNPPGTSSRIGQIAFITQALTGDANAYIKGMADTVDPERFSLATYTTHSNLNRYRHVIENVIRQRPAGVVLGTTFKELDKVQGELFIRAGIPVVTLGQEQVPNLVCDAVRDSAAEGAMHVARYILERRYRDLAFLSQSPVSAKETIDTLRSELVPAGISLPDDRILSYDDSRGYADPPNPYIDAEECLAGRLAEGFRCECLVCGHDYAAVGGLRAILAAGIRVPREMKVISVLADPVEGISPMKLTTLDIHRELQGRKAIQLLVRRIDGYQGPSEIHYIATGLVKGDTA